MSEQIEIEVVYGLAHKQKLISMQVEQGTTVRQGAELSGLDKEFPELNIAESKLGIFGKTVRSPDTEVLKAGDRIEIYRPLIIDPKAARANRAAKAAK
ncbi:MAG TPA: RnfH family protein [Oceanospirillales bacterium]|jgi:putative ubiquitin-RnfH superfamily antitoxin RatB of RatAB toxin-antitoxin module|nr:RnfH family protein [Oceanospirillales bacterium]|tara:strand:- start:1503 stop:1796 length:294 start_codon:yes stop_codon:yes gene_type:complete